MPLPKFVEGRVCSLSDLADTTVDVDAGNITIDEITSRNRPIHVGQQSSISQNTLTTVTTMPANGIKWITKVLCSGEENAKWDIFIDSVRKATMRTTDRNVAFDFNLPMKILATEVVDIKVTHHGPDSTATFEATIFGYQEVT
jgi:hypothetical protein